MKTTNIGVLGNPYTNLSSDPSAQWPGPSGVEYLYYIGLWVGAVIPGEVDPALRYRVSNSTTWRPPSLDPIATARTQSLAIAKPGPVDYTLYKVDWAIADSIAAQAR